MFLCTSLLNLSALGTLPGKDVALAMRAIGSTPSNEEVQVGCARIYCINRKHNSNCTHNLWNANTYMNYSQRLHFKLIFIFLFLFIWIEGNLGWKGWAHFGRIQRCNWIDRKCLVPKYLKFIVPLFKICQCNSKSFVLYLHCSKYQPRKM